MNSLLSQAEEILEIAAAGRQEGTPDMDILIDRDGGMQMLEAASWPLPALRAERGSVAAYRVKRRAFSVSVEVSSGSERYLLQRQIPAQNTPAWLGCPAIRQAMMLYLPGPELR